MCVFPSRCSCLFFVAVELSFSQKQLLGAVVSGNADVDGLLLQVREKAVLLQVAIKPPTDVVLRQSLTLHQACAFVRQPATPAAVALPPRLDAALPEVSNND